MALRQLNPKACFEPSKILLGKSTLCIHSMTLEELDFDVDMLLAQGLVRWVDADHRHLAGTLLGVWVAEFVNAN